MELNVNTSHAIDYSATLLPITLSQSLHLRQDLRLEKWKIGFYDSRMQQKMPFVAITSFGAATFD